MRTARPAARTSLAAVPSLAHMVASALACALLCASIAGCKKKQEEPIDVAPPRGAANADELSIGIGQARGLAEGMASTSTKWQRVIVLDDKRALVTGDLATEVVALATNDAGKSWHPLRYEHEAWAGWSAAMDGTIVLVSGARGGATAATGGSIEAGHLLFASFDAPNFTAPSPFFPLEKGPAKGTTQGDAAIPALINPDTAAVIADENARTRVVFYGGRPGAEPVPRTALPAGEKIVPTAYGRPAVLLSIKGRDLLSRPFPEPQKPLEAPKKVPGVVLTPTLLAELSAPPACEDGAWSFQRIKQPGGKVAVLGVSAEKTVIVPLPDTTLPATTVGCGGGKLIVQVTDPKTKALALSTCDLDATCTAPLNDSLRDWPEKHEHDIQTVGLANGVVSALSEHVGARWGLYLSASNDGATWERPRVIGEGNGDRGRIELGALVPFGKRVVLLVSADVTGTSRRGWFTIASEDGGINWGPP
ncbi:MAG: hypothetical protein U0359_25070 [Byssovorax sp.]